ncbi:MAG TPA: hypothetical protein VF069_25320 [Streptosporangiaceae bacterium]
MAYERHPPERLPVRGRSTLPGGRHRRPDSAELPPDAPALVLAVPYAATAGGGPRPAGWDERTATDIASLTRAARADVDIRVGRVSDPGGPPSTLTEILRDVARSRAPAARSESGAPPAPSWGATGPAGTAGAPGGGAAGQRGGQGPQAVVVPLLTGPHDQAYDQIHRAVAASGTAAVVTEPLGPHPLLAEALHVRLAESGLARADRIRQFSIGAAVDGVVVATMGGQAAVNEAEITAVLLAARLAVPVVAASLDARPSVGAAAARLRDAGARRLALAPHLIGPEGDHQLLAAAAAEVDAGCAGPLGAHETIVRLVNLRYEVALEELAFPAPHGSPESAPPGAHQNAPPAVAFRKETP